MADEPTDGKREPQSYGSGGDWVTGTTGQNVNEPKSTPAPEHADFYDERREAETTAPHQGGHVSPHQLAETPESPSEIAREDPTPGRKVTVQAGGTKSDSFFRKRDYE